MCFYRVPLVAADGGPCHVWPVSIDAAHKTPIGRQLFDHLACPQECPLLAANLPGLLL